MAIIELSSGFITSGNYGGYTQRLINLNGGGLTRNGLISPSANSPPANSFLQIMQGVVPTNFTGLVVSSRSSDTLLSFWRGANEILVNFPGNNTAIFSTIYKNASASGTATWFWLRQVGNGGAGDPIQQQMIGTVGTNGSGADMEISSTNIVSGSPYRVISSQITLPTSWTY